MWPAVVACVCPTWPLRKQMRKKIWGNLFAFPLRKRKRNKISRFSFVIISVWMVRGHTVKCQAPQSQTDSSVSVHSVRSWTTPTLQDRQKIVLIPLFQARKQSTNPCFWVRTPDILWLGGGLLREGVGPKTFGMSLETKGNELFGERSRDFAGVSQSCPKVGEKKVCVQLLAPTLGTLSNYLSLFAWHNLGLRLTIWDCFHACIRPWCPLWYPLHSQKVRCPPLPQVYLEQKSMASKTGIQCLHPSCYLAKG